MNLRLSELAEKIAKEEKERDIIEFIAYLLKESDVLPEETRKEYAKIMNE